MNRSQRRAAVISWAVTAAVLCGGVGAAPAQADPADTNQSSAEVGGKPRARSQSPATRPDDAVAYRRPAVRAAVRAPAGAPTHTDTAGETGEWPCHLPWLWPVPPEPVTSTRAMAAVPTVVPSPVLSPVLYPTLAERPLPGFVAEALAGIAASGPEVPQMLPPASPAGALPPSPAPSPAPAPARSPRALTATASVPLSVPAPASPAEALTPPEAPVPQRGDVMPPAAARLGYPGYLRDADIAQIAALALSGLAGILGMTALGGFLGYRQAKVGYMLRAGGIARFLQ